MQALHRQVNDAGLLFLNEMGLDPGIDHMSACEWIDHVHAQGGEIIHFKSHCGGLVAKESNDNPWGYKFSWNPRNVVLAGQGNGFIRWRENNTIKYLPYHRLFASATTVVYKGEAFDSYPNRDSLVYIEPYKLQNAQTVYRGTLRYKGFCNAWHQLVYLGLCDNTTLLDINENETYASFLLKFLKAENNHDIDKKLAEALQISSESEAFKKLKWLGLLENKKIPLTGQHTAAQVLQTILEEKWKLKPGDKDRVVMIHEFTYRLNEKLLATTAVLDITGTEQHTAMATTVGLPIGIAARMIIHKTISLKGVIRPVCSEIYSPVLKQLSQCGINFNIKTVGL
ncbi:MAG: saccharopine dehydrogenase C-terminal domain-containing protein [Chitinophagales bacterium]|nr:saccharopine dehydrogenase C-terminal domain-containing protein [Chitinophagales bacterium]